MKQKEKECAVTVENKITGQCECDGTFFINNCLNAAMQRYRPHIYMICGSCFWKESNMVFHDCRSSRSELESQVKKLFTNICLIYDLCETYCREHGISIFDILLKNFESAIQKWVNENTSKVLDIMLEKDKSARNHFSWIY